MLSRSMFAALALATAATYSEANPYYWSAQPAYQPTYQPAYLPAYQPVYQSPTYTPTAVMPAGVIVTSPTSAVTSSAVHVSGYTPVTAAGYPAAKNDSLVKVSGVFDIFRAQPFTLVLLLTVLVLYVTAVYGPIAAALVELFPTRIRYTSMSLPYHIGNGWFGGFLPAISFALVAATGNLYYGLWYPIGIAVMTLIIGTLFLRETNHVDITK